MEYDIKDRVRQTHSNIDTILMGCLLFSEEVPKNELLRMEAVNQVRKGGSNIAGDDEAWKILYENEAFVREVVKSNAW